ncbi:hypothetical protein IT575_10395 [bacterium]|nr:hypothetical protein [bacterium]
MRSRSMIAVLAALLLAGMVSCGGSGFTPDPGPYDGVFTVNGSSDGNLSFTVINGQLGGTARFTHNDQTVVAAISGAVSGNQISGNVQATNLGFGPFQGSFSNDAASGSFSYTDSGGISTTTGTWAVSLGE